MKKIYKNFFYKTLIIGTVLTVSSCKKFVELGAPPTQILFEDAFRTDASAQSTVLGLYSNNVTTSSIGNFSFFSGISADDLQYNGVDAALQEFANNAITTTNITASNIWANTYGLIKNTNNVISGISASNTLTPSIKNQLLGEAKFMRAYAYFYLVNLYGDIPLPLKDDYSAFENATLPRIPAAQVYAQIIKDLTEAQGLLPVEYVANNLRIRVNKYAATALLARVYLYQKDYVNAEAQATQIIGANIYGMPGPNASFLNNSSEVIWQLATLTGFSTFGANYVTTTATSIPVFSLADVSYQGFESAADLRRSTWITPKIVSGKTYYGISKYKLTSGNGTEYNIVLRLAEQYLIRAEARAQQNNLSGAKTDIDMVRTRAGLDGVSATLDQGQMLTAIEQERKVEFFGEWGHRWLDLKRTGRANVVINALKPTWKSTSVLFPIPQAQILANPSLTQNPGYQN
ncbi:SusD-like protein BACOVA_02651 [Pedobacter sp. Bi27]|uniref:RagB/SusD family nutrient uptake outer membrane protein n=1 Tax=Pedobacter sp. Bi27 TaxID=2822351 RepID=UPI001D911B55|nr:RagB/SusD family nutrient uptake outer membrane protein [Pedobacter sp. Bi27]CAH0318877.1 SusD-like protein BACOVA_02651 [Pedobacter sp. Bi27]